MQGIYPTRYSITLAPSSVIFLGWCGGLPWPEAILEIGKSFTDVRFKTIWRVFGVGVGVSPGPPQPPSFLAPCPEVSLLCCLNPRMCTHVSCP